MAALLGEPGGFEGFRMVTEVLLTVELAWAPDAEISTKAALNASATPTRT